MGVPLRLLEMAATHNAVTVPGTVAYVGTLAAVRRLDVIIDAFAIVRDACPDARLIVIGDGDIPAERAALEYQVRRLGLTEQVHFTGFLPVDDVWRILGTAAVGLSPISVDRVLKVASPTKLVEYLAMRKPVVCNDHPEQSAIIRDSNAGISVAWGARQFAEAMIWMLKHPEEAQTMGELGPAWVRENRTYPIIAAGVFARYRQILGQAA